MGMGMEMRDLGSVCVAHERSLYLVEMYQFTFHEMGHTTEGITHKAGSKPDEFHSGLSDCWYRKLD